MQVATADAAKRPRKLGEVIAARILADIVRQGWREGDVLGNELDLMKRYAISRATFREAVRQLEWHGTAAMRRGANGGLLVKAPPRHAIVAAIGTYFALTRVGQAERDEVAQVLRAAPRAGSELGPNEAIALFLEALEMPAAHDASRTSAKDGAKGPAGADAGLGAVAAPCPKLSETVARRLVHDIAATASAPGTALGSAADLQRRYGVSRAILREALRPLELHDIVRVKTGAQGGVIVHNCDPAYTIELASTYLACAGISLPHKWEANSSLEIAALERFTKLASPAALQELRRAYRKLERAHAPDYFASAIDFHQVIADHSGNRALSLLVGILLRFGLEVLPDPDPRYLPWLKGEHLKMIEVVEAGDSDAASAIMRRVFDHSRRWVLRVEADRQAGPPGEPAAP